MNLMRKSRLVYFIPNIQMDRFITNSEKNVFDVIKPKKNHNNFYYAKSVGWMHFICEYFVTLKIA